jgi:hypothetical protein
MKLWVMAPVRGLAERMRGWGQKSQLVSELFCPLTYSKGISVPANGGRNKVSSLVLIRNCFFTAYCTERYVGEGELLLGCGHHERSLGRERLECQKTILGDSALAASRREALPRTGVVGGKPLKGLHER